MVGFLGAEQAVFAGVGVKAQHGHPGLFDAEIVLERMQQNAQLGREQLLGEACGHVFERDVARDGGYPQLVGHQQHQAFLGFEEGGQELGVAGKAEVVGLGVLLADGRRDEGVEQASLEVAGSGEQTLAGRRPAGRTGLAGRKLHVVVAFPAAHGVDACRGQCRPPRAPAGT